VIEIQNYKLFFKLKKLFVAGCSFSDYTHVEKTYGELLANKLNYEYVHEGAGCGSNWRIWRTITKYILNNKLSSDDLLIVQYTEITRNEFWSVLPQPSHSFWPSTPSKLKIFEKTKDGTIIRYKMGASGWQNNKKESEFLEMYENYFVSVNFAREQFMTQNYMFQKMLLSNNIRVIFINSPRYPVFMEDILPEFVPYVFSEPISFNDFSQYNLLPDDFGHMNQKGHEVFAEWLNSHIEKIF
jgi:hypothetical protein